MTIIYYVGADIASESILDLWHHFGTLPKHPHVTIIYSKNKWFPYKFGKFFPLVIEPPYKYDEFREQTVLRFKSQRLFERYTELLNMGAISDYGTFQPHITIGPKALWKPLLPDFPIILSNEYYQTWEEK